MNWYWPGNRNARLAVLGLAYKENTHSVKNSPSLALIRHLAPWHSDRVRSGGAGRRRPPSQCH